MTHDYTIEGMTCSSCAAKVKSQLLTMAGVDAAHVQLDAPQASITMQKHISLNDLQAAIYKAGNYRIAEAGGGMEHTGAVSLVITYKPVLLIFAFITGISLLLQGVAGVFNWQTWMQHFMAGFFLVFSFFKLLDVKAFANSYAMYDLVAKKWNAWGYIYPFAELTLGIAWLVFPDRLFTSIITLVVMGASVVGVLQTVLAKKQIQCACLGAVFKLPMSTITIIEDGLMIGMSMTMLFSIM